MALAVAMRKITKTFGPLVANDQVDFDLQEGEIVLIETLESFSPEQIYELDTTDKTIHESADLAEKFFRGNIPSSHVLWTGPRI